MKRERRTPSWILSLGALGFAALGTGLMLQPGCSSDACVGSGDRDVPSATLECPAGELCYHGQCLRGCNAGQARLSCSTSDECDASRPNCINDRIAGGLFCSVCDDGQACVPSLNVCQPLAEAVIPEEPNRPRPEDPKPIYPLDASFTPTGLRPTKDAGPPPVAPSVPYTHAVFVDVAQELDKRPTNPINRGSIRVRGIDLRPSDKLDGRWRLDHPNVLWEPKTTTGTNSIDYCTFRRLQRPDVIVAPANIGKIRLDSDTDISVASINGDYEASFNNGGYDVTRVDTMVPTMTLANPLINLSVPDGQPYQLILSAASQTEVTPAGWPSSGESKFFIPYELVPIESGSVNLSAVVVVPATPEDLVFRWVPVRTGVDVNLRVGVRVYAGDAEITCEVRESIPPVGSDPTLEPIITDVLTLPGSLLSSLRATAGPGDYPIYFERRRRALVYVPGIVDANGNVVTAITAEAWVRHSLIGTLRL
ncbi:MAG: hypothetical protein IPG45_22845 [Deltaproteobacteria bacterium]|jgi:hypothetical protein|nr:hypothetical protein [Deltaproteobacteria bacterium]